MRSWVHGSNGHSSFSNLKILVYWVTPVLIDLHRFILSLLGTHRFYILNQRPIAPNPFAVALEAPGDGDFYNTQFASHDASFDVLSRYWIHSWKYYCFSCPIPKHHSHGLAYNTICLCPIAFIMMYGHAEGLWACQPHRDPRWFFPFMRLVWFVL